MVWLLSENSGPPVTLRKMFEQRTNYKANLRKRHRTV